MTLYLGTSGWAYPEWRPDFYPKGLGQRRWLAYYASVFDACEINATFYRLQSEATLQRWAESTPGSFRFAVKAHRRLTHARGSRFDAGFLNEFLRSLAPLRDKLAVLLFQFPPRLERDDALLESYLLASYPAPVVFEFRHHSWNDREVHQRIASGGAGVCLADTSAEPPDALPPGNVAYVRLRAERYTASQRQQWYELLWGESALRDVFGFAKHEGAPVNDPLAGLGMARWMSRRTEGKTN